MQKMESRRRWELDARRRQLLERGLELFAEKSYEEVSIDEIAQAAGVSKGLLYHYFSGKRGFYIETIRLAAESLLEAVAPDMTLPPQARAFSGITAYLDFVTQRARAYVALMQGGVGVDREVARILEDTRATIARRLLEGLGLKTPRPIFRTLIRSWIQSVEAASLDQIQHQDIAREVVVEMLVKTLYHTLMTACELDPEAGVELPAPRGPGREGAS